MRYSRDTSLGSCAIVVGWLLSERMNVVREDGVGEIVVECGGKWMIRGVKERTAPKEREGAVRKSPRVRAGRCFLLCFKYLLRVVQHLFLLRSVI